MQNGGNKHGVNIVTSKMSGNAANINYEKVSNGAWGPALPEPLKNVLPFEPDFTMFIGSPVGLFLTLRGAHAIFDHIRDVHPRRPKVSPFTLPTRAMYNIYSPSDPVAYRIEPLLLAQGTEKLPNAIYLTRLGEGVRFHVKAMQLGDEIRRGTLSLFSGVSKGKLSEADDVTMMDKCPKQQSETHGKKANATKDDVSCNDENNALIFPLGGKSQRLDYQLQPGVIDSEYISAVTAHSSYFQNMDIIDFAMDIAGQTNIVIDLTTDEGAAEQLLLEDGKINASC